VTSNVDSTQLQDVAIHHNIQVERTKENCEKPYLVNLVYQLRYELGMSSMLLQRCKYFTVAY